MDPTKERNLRASGTDEMSRGKRRTASTGDSVPRALGFIALLPSQRINFVAGAQLGADPSLVLAPESALSLLPSRGLSSDPAVCSVSAAAVLNKRGTKKELEYRSAFRHVR